MPKIQTWNSEDQAKLELEKRLRNARDTRKKYEYQWEYNERTLQNTKGALSTGEHTSLSFDSEAELSQYEDDSSIGVNYTFKNLRLIHSQLSANPPTVVARPTSNDSEDRRKADTADRLIRYAIRQYKLQEVFDRITLDVLYYGTGFIKIINDPTKGQLLEFDESTGEMTLEGDISIKTASPWNIFVDPDGDTWEEVKYVIEKMWLPYEEALFQFPDKKEILDKIRTTEVNNGHDSGSYEGSDTAIYGKKYDVVEVYQYWEKGLPHNGFQGRFCYMLKDGTPLTAVTANPHRFSPPVAEGEAELPPVAYLPYHIMTDLDVPNSVWGKATVDYEAPLQDTHNKMINVMMDSLRAHGVARLVIADSAEISDDSITNSPWDIIRITGGNGQTPHFMQPMPFPAAFSEMMGMIQNGINESAGVNDAMFGDIKRETSGFSLQYATNQGNMIRRRLFNKYVLLTESVYKTFLELVRTHWTAPRQIKVLGSEKAFNVMEIDGTDIAGGYDLVVEYGASLSLDPTTRREEILTLLPLFEKAGISTRRILSLLKLNELEGAFDRVKLAEDRQYEVFKEMTTTGLYIQPEELQDHQNMLDYAYEYVMTSEFKYLDEDSKTLIEKHIRDREQMAAQGPAPAPGAMGAELADPTAGMTGSQPDVTQLGALLGGQLPES